ncbi:MAG: prefoldin subunit alpha [Candidatus Heimdallarchaeota archaeon]|nr:prefoldin subunit alpha [Candidatus Heimdallarchaeota archaeon]MCK5159099.1 prefoldin subunit alpha [Candidatus Heimdallarchaeota archaeon]MCK5298856.1 prefoldin subunit alpha [Candidatus Heimdallarchaeota archaeon]
MSEDQLRNEFQQISNEIQRYDEYGKQLQVQIETRQYELVDLNRSKSTLTGLKNEKNTEEILVQMGPGILMKVKPIEVDKVLYSVGAGVVLKKPIDEAVKGVEEKIEQVEKERLALADQLNKIIESIGNLERRAQSIYKQLQGPSQPQYDPSLVS